MCSLLGFAQIVDRSAGDDLTPVIEEDPQGLAEIEQFGLPLDDGEKIDPEGILHRGHLEELVQDDLADSVPLEFDDDTHPIAIGLVAKIGDSFDLLLVHEFGDALDQSCLVDLIGDGVDDDGIAPRLRVGLDLGTRPHLQNAAPGRIGFLDRSGAADVAAGREIRACLLYTSPSPRDQRGSRMPSSA